MLDRKNTTGIEGIDLNSCTVRDAINGTPYTVPELSEEERCKGITIRKIDSSMKETAAFCCCNDLRTFTGIAINLPSGVYELDGTCPICGKECTFKIIQQKKRTER